MRLKVLVVGASSGVGLQVVKSLLEAEEKYEVLALVRSQERASKAIGPDSSKVKFVHGDITKKETLVPACQGVDAVVCAVGAQAGWRFPGWNQNTPKYVDYLGSQNLIQAAVEAKVPKFVYVSSVNITRPFSFIAMLLNTLFGRVLHWKLKAEKALRKEYKTHDDLAYYIVRPGGLNNNEGGKSGIRIEQGDIGTGNIPRRDVATVVLACVDGASKPNVTFEIYSDKKDEVKDLSELSTLLPDELQ
ncbi:unnamed protein product [Calypogeia fissa]